jgi:hypothetical protein
MREACARVSSAGIVQPEDLTDDARFIRSDDKLASAKIRARHQGLRRMSGCGRAGTIGP